MSKKRCMAYFLLVFLLILVSVIHGADQTIMKISAETDAFSQMWTGTYPYLINYNDIFGEEYVGSDEHVCNGSNKVVGLNANTGALAEIPENNNYGVDVCYGDLKCQSVIRDRFERVFGETTYDLLSFVSGTSDEGFMIGSSAKYPGSTEDFAKDYYGVLTKTDSSGYVEWTKTFTGIEGAEMFSGTKTSDGGFVHVGRTQSGSHDYALIRKTNANGNEIWKKTHEYYRLSNPGNTWNTATLGAMAYGVEETSDGGLIIVGHDLVHKQEGWNLYIHMNVYLLKLDANGNKEWESSIGGKEDYSMGFSVKETSDGGYILTGRYIGGGRDQIILIKTNSNGVHQWTKEFGGTGPEEGLDVIETSDGGFMVASSYTVSSSFYSHVIKTNSAGVEEWSNNYDAAGSTAFYILTLPSDKYLIITNLDDQLGGLNIGITKINGAGQELNTWDYGIGIYDSSFFGNKFQQTSDGGFIIGGHTASGWLDNTQEIYLFKLDSNMNVVALGGNCSTEYPGSEEVIRLESDTGAKSEMYGRDDYLVSVCCESENIPIVEICDGIDNTGEGDIDENCPYGELLHASCANGIYGWCLDSRDTEGDPIDDGTSNLMSVDIYYSENGGPDQFLTQLTTEFQPAHAPPPEPILDIGYGVQDPFDDSGGSIALHGENLYILGGTTINNGDVWLIKTDLAGNVFWNKTKDWNNNPDGGTDIAVDNSGNTFVLAIRNSQAAPFYGYTNVLKYDPIGNLLWDSSPLAHFPGTPSSIAVDVSGSPYVTVTKTPSFESKLVKLYSSNGSVEWEKTLTDSGNAMFINGYDIYIAGTKNNDLFVAKYDSTGNNLWTQTYDGGHREMGNGITVHPSGEIYVVGQTHIQTEDILLVKYSGAGVKIWNTTIGGLADDKGYSVTTDSDGYVYVAGYTQSFGLNKGAAWIIKFDSNGNYIANKTVGGLSGKYEGADIVTDSSYLYVTGSKFDPSSGSGGDVLLLKLTKGGLTPVSNGVKPNGVFSMTDMTYFGDGVGDGDEYDITAICNPISGSNTVNLGTVNLDCLSTEICNGEDDDCNGLIDDEGGIEGKICQPDITCGSYSMGESRSCYTGPAGTEGVGICIGGTETCQPDGTWTLCIGEVLPDVEAKWEDNCEDGINNDCDSEMDWDFSDSIHGEEDCPIRILNIDIGSPPD